MNRPRFFFAVLIVVFVPAANAAVGPAYPAPIPPTVTSRTRNAPPVGDEGWCVVERPEGVASVAGREAPRSTVAPLRTGPPCLPALRPQDILVFENSADVLVTTFSDADYLALRVAAVNSLIATSIVFEETEFGNPISRPPGQVPELICGGVEFPVAGTLSSQKGGGSRIMRRGSGGGLAVDAGAAPCIPQLRREDIFASEDAAGLLLTDYSNAEYEALRTAAVNALIADHGDYYHFFGFFTNFVPHHQVGIANYGSSANDVAGIGTDIRWNQPLSGIDSDRVEGLVMLYDVNNIGYAPGAGNPTADFTRYNLAHEFEHRFALYLPDLLDGRKLQQSSECPGFFGEHWNPRVDCQGGALYLREWIGSNPAIPGGDCFTPDGFSGCRNLDIPGGQYSYTDLYLMGYITAAEMDAGNSELRYMDEGCSSQIPPDPYFGPISTFSSADIIAAAGPRVPTPLSSRKHYRAAWIMIHQPGDPPSNAERDKAIGMLEQMTIDWTLSTLRRGTLSHSLSTDCNCNGVADDDDISMGTSGGCNSDGVPDECGRDCNANSQRDLCEIAAGLQPDCNMNGVPDGCELAGGEVVLLEEDFNDGLPAGWAANGIFHLSGACNSEPGCNNGLWAYAGREPSCSLSLNVGGELVLPNLAISDRGAILRYCARFDSTPDRTYAEVRVNGEVIQRETGGSEVWESRALDLSDFAGRTITLSFNLFTGFDPAATGWRIDNVRVITGDSDCNGNGVPDGCDTNGGASPDCNANVVPDECDIAVGTSLDCDGDGVPNECEPDCNFNGAPDDCDLAASTSFDCNANQIPDECETGADTTTDTYLIPLADLIDVPGICGAGIAFNQGNPALRPGFRWLDTTDGHVLSLAIEVDMGLTCIFAGDPHELSLNGVAWQSFTLTSRPCLCGLFPPEVGQTSGSAAPYVVGRENTVRIMNPLGFTGFAPNAAWSGAYARVTVTYNPVPADCNSNRTPDACDIRDGVSQDLDLNGLPDECESAVPAASTWGILALALSLLTAGTLVARRSVRECGL